MQQKTKGIVLANLAYNDKYSIIQVFTEESGRISYMLPRKSSKRQTLSKALFMPLSLLEIQTSCSGKREIYPLKEARSLYPLHRIYTSPIKSSLLFFIAEILTKALREAPADILLFRYLEKSILFLEETEQSIANFHILFLFRLTRFLGFPPNLSNHSGIGYFDMIEGCFVATPPIHNHYLPHDEGKILLLLEKMDFPNMALFSFSKKERFLILERIIEYFRLHIPNFTEIKSYSVLQEIFS
ncbi:MAG: DNA repair protein RecO [Bacteroidales bacterium]|nr:DNA repair protein RecO [Bacteroidales bacterium]